MAFSPDGRRLVSWGLDSSIRVWDTTADTRYMVLPQQPPETIGWPEEKLAGIVDVLKPHLCEVYERHIRETDQIADAPTIGTAAIVKVEAAWNIGVWSRKMSSRPYGSPIRQ